MLFFALIFINYTTKKPIFQPIFECNAELWNYFVKIFDKLLIFGEKSITIWIVWFTEKTHAG